MKAFEFTGDISSEWNCEQIASISGDDLELILKETAEATLKAVESVQVELVTSTGGVENRLLISGSAFWEESNDNSFGNYGFFRKQFRPNRFY